jgi:hypothetical protein
MLAFDWSDMLISSPNLIEPKEFILFFEVVNRIETEEGGRTGG